LHNGTGVDFLFELLRPEKRTFLDVLTLILVEMHAGREATAAEASTTRILRAPRRALTKPVVLAPALGIVFSLSDVSIGTVAEAWWRQRREFPEFV
jgi:predicted permease